jgi:hypothetical protein
VGLHLGHYLFLSRVPLAVGHERVFWQSRLRQLRAGHISPVQVGSPQGSFFQVGYAQVDTEQIASRQVGLCQISAAQVGTTEVCPA